ncbi:MAG: CD225/dispanin family protein [Tannerella sp.]|jgi:sensor histidine kinase YesM|nr:CD225/dispanin family protein [Tannerella sp.]
MNTNSSNGLVYAGLTDALNENLRLQNEYDFVATDVKPYNRKNLSFQFLPSYSDFVEDGNKLFPMAKCPSIAVMFCIDKSSQESEKFKQMDIFTRFTDISYRQTSDELEIFAIDFGEDADSAAQVFTNVMISVYGYSGNETCDCKTWKEGKRKNNDEVITKQSNVTQKASVEKTPKTGFILGLFSVLLFWIPFLTLPIPICGLVFSTKELQQKSNALSRAGQIMSILGLMLGILMIILLMDNTNNN